MTTTLLTLARLGLGLSGTNVDLEVLSSDKPESGEGDGDSSDGDESEDEDGDGSESGEEAESDGDEEDSGSGSGDDDSDESEDEDGDESDGSESGDKAEGDSDGDSSDGEGDEDGDESEGEGGDSSDGDSSDGDSGPSEGEGSPGKGSEADEDGDPEPEADPEEDSTSPGGGFDNSEQAAIAKEALEAMENGTETGLADNNSALGDALKGETDAAANDCAYNEQVWRPHDPTLDDVKLVQRADEGTARHLQSKVKKEIAFLRSKLRAKFLQARAPRHIHGVRKGRELSERRLVSSVVELRSNQRPTRPDWRVESRPECTLAAAVVIDQSGSMRSRRTMASMAALAIATPFDELGSPCLVVGPRNGRYSGSNRYNGPQDAHTPEGHARYHRTEGVQIDVFKDWDESMRSALCRFPNVRASGSTPLSDGIQYALQSLSDRPEKHRVVLVITDGEPDNSAVCRRLIRIAAEQGVIVVGVGIGGGCMSVKALFPNHVAVEMLSELPREMLGVLDTIMFPKVGGRKINLEGKMNSRVSR